MCSVSDKIVLCTCDVKDAQRLKYYWILYRHDPDHGELLIGETLGFEYAMQKSDPHNPVILCNKLNEGNLFDKPIELKDKDRLQISLLFNGNHTHTDYGFEYKDGKWRVIDYEFFTWKIEHIELQGGKIKNVLAIK